MLEANVVAALLTARLVKRRWKGDSAHRCVLRVSLSRDDALAMGGAIQRRELI